MRVALLSAGLSLAATFGALPAVEAAGFDLRVGVNAAATLYACDWWSVGDDLPIRTMSPVGRPAICTLGVSADRLIGSGYLDGRALLRWEELAPPPVTEWDTYSATAALVLCKHLGATRIDVFGVDMDGVRDCRGVRGGNRLQPRWAQERRIWDGLERWLRSSGVQVVRCQLTEAIS